MRDGFIDSIIPYLRGEIKGQVFFVQMKEKGKALGDCGKRDREIFLPREKNPTNCKKGIAFCKKM